MAIKVPPNILTDTPIYRMVHIDCLDTLLSRQVIHAPAFVPPDQMSYPSIHDDSVQLARGTKSVPCGPKGSIRDYVGFYLGPRSPMLYRIATGRGVKKCSQDDIIYLVTTAQTVLQSGLGFVFSDRHSLTRVAAWYDDLEELKRVDFNIAYAEFWNTTEESPDRQEKKQAEFLVHQSLPWNLITEIGVSTPPARSRVLTILDSSVTSKPPQVVCRPSWYY